MDQRIEAELALAGIQLPKMPDGRDWVTVLSAIRTKIEALSKHPLIANDPECVAVLTDMVTSGDMPDFARRVDELAYRVAWLLREQDGDEVDLFLSKPIRKAVKGMDSSRPTSLEEEGSGAKAARTQFRL